MCRAATTDFDRDLTALLPRLRICALSLTHDRDRAGDLVQETTAKALAGRASFRSGTNFAAWLHLNEHDVFVSGLRRTHFTALLIVSTLVAIMTTFVPLSRAQTPVNIVAPDLQIAAAPAQIAHALPPGLPQGTRDAASVMLPNVPAWEMPHAVWTSRGTDRFTGLDNWEYASACTVIREWVPLSKHIRRCDVITMSGGGYLRFALHTSLLSGVSSTRPP